MLRGPSGVGKTDGAKAIAAGLGLPYVFITCSTNTEIMDFIGQILPDVDIKKSPQAGNPYPTFEDITMDPATAYQKMTGEYIEDITEDDVYKKLIEIIETRSGSGDKHGFQYVDTPLIDAIRYGYLCEIQERATRFRLKRPDSRKQKDRAVLFFPQRPRSPIA